ncbi:MAG: cysteine desulfurase NifS [Candidatus Firestonebacteria bacterium RIFOXYC2_FULL_39_67]|nr:MAG: cysteine desulfurase NifS [Candidatus Firestonebacteria bacterium RIFOXYD2_FULL_39_29]OGF52613.1 MAG: cysteine desulfurase NifS [Candidatus Firestonebacteria bacterium RifOxyC12_full_39_7]OGF56390.1 MAG: cysteine desulfurase NifS [Candidatus Firestonebacteria bacterium RIFOXYC2_FULL_39_67]
MKRIYLDYAATTPVHPDVLSAMTPYFMELFGNASTIYHYGRESKKAIEEARESFAKIIGADQSEVIFTSGGTESDNHAIKGAAYANRTKGNHIITCKIEHHAVLETCHYLEKEGFKVTYLPVDTDGLVNLEELKKAITDKTILISIMAANNEIGVLQPIAEIGKIAREKKIVFHTDAVQMAGSLPIDVEKMNIDLLSVSAHKLYGPKGIGGLYIRKGVKISPFIHGGEQEKRRRAGTENVPGIVGFGKACEIAMQNMEKEAKRISGLRDKFIEGLMKIIPEVKLNGHAIKRLPNNVNVSVKYIEGESMILNLDMEGICASSGSACTSGSLEPSHVLMSLGLSHELSHGSVRFTLGKNTTEDELSIVLEKFSETVDRLRKLSPLYKPTKK